MRPASPPSCHTASACPPATITPDTSRTAAPAEAGVRVSKKPTAATLLMQAFKDGRHRTILSLCTGPASSYTAIDQQGQNILHCAVAYGDVSVLTYMMLRFPLLYAYADLTRQGAGPDYLNTPMGMAYLRPDSTMFHCLARMSLDRIDLMIAFNQRSKHADTVYPADEKGLSQRNVCRQAAGREKDKHPSLAVERLVNRQALLLEQNADTALDASFGAKLIRTWDASDRPALQRIIARYGFDMYRPMSDGANILHYAASRNDTEGLQWLIDKLNGITLAGHEGAGDHAVHFAQHPLYRHDEQGLTPLHHAVLNANETALMTLLPHYPHMPTDSFTQMPLGQMLLHQNPRVARNIFEKTGCLALLSKQDRTETLRDALEALHKNASWEMGDAPPVSEIRNDAARAAIVRKILASSRGSLAILTPTNVDGLSIAELLKNRSLPNRLLSPRELEKCLAVHQDDRRSAIVRPHSDEAAAAAAVLCEWPPSPDVERAPWPSRWATLAWMLSYRGQPPDFESAHR